MTLIGKGHHGVKKPRVIDLDPFGGYELVERWPAFAGKPHLFWHSDGENYKSFGSNFFKVVGDTAAWAKKNGVPFRRFRFHDLRHLHAVNWLKHGGSIYALSLRLGHTSVQVTEKFYLAYLTPEEALVAKGLVPAPSKVAKAGVA